MSSTLYQIANSNYVGSGSIGFGTVVSKFGRVAGQSGFQIEPDNDTANIYLTARYATMSKYNPSLVIIPSAYSSSVLYTLYAFGGGTGDFTVTNNGSGSVVNRSGLVLTGSAARANIARLDYYTGSVGSSSYPSLLVEPAATNYIRESQFNTFATNWNFIFGTIRSTASLNTTETLSPSGDNTALKLTLYTGSNTDRLRQRFTGSNPSSIISILPTPNNSTFNGVSGSFSIWLKQSGSILTTPQLSISPAGEGGPYAATINYNLSTGTASIAGTVISMSVSPSMDRYGNGWWRCKAGFDIATNLGSYGTESGSLSFGITPVVATSAVSQSMYVWGGQLELGATSSLANSSYILTTNNSSSRTADVISVSGAVSGSIGQTEGTLYAEVDVRLPGRTIIECNNRGGQASGSIDARVGLQFSSASGNTLTAFVVSGGTTVLTLANTLTSAGIVKIAFGYKTGDSALYVNGVSGGVSTSAFTFPATMNEANLGQARSAVSGLGINVLNDRIRAVALYTTRLSNAELAALTT